MLWTDKNIHDIIWQVDNRRIESNGLDSEIFPIIEQIRNDYEDYIKNLKEEYVALIKETENYD